MHHIVSSLPLSPRTLSLIERHVLSSTCPLAAEHRARLGRLLVSHSEARTTVQRFRALEEIIYAAHFQWSSTPAPHLHAFTDPRLYQLLLRHWPVEADSSLATGKTAPALAMREAWLRNHGDAPQRTLAQMQAQRPPPPQEALDCLQPIMQHFSYLMTHPTLLRHRRSKSARLLPLALPLTPLGQPLPPSRAANMLRARVSAVHGFLAHENPALSLEAARVLAEEIAAESALPRHVRRRYRAVCKHAYTVVPGEDGLQFERVTWGG